MPVFHVKAYKTIVHGMDVEADNAQKAELEYLLHNTGVQVIIEVRNMTELWISQGVEPEIAKHISQE